MTSTIESCELFKGLDSAALMALKAVAEERAYATDELVFEEGAPGDGLYVVQEGEVEITAALDGGPHRLVSRLVSGEAFGEMAFIEAKPRSATAKASQPSKLAFLPAKGLRAVLEENPTLATSLLQQISSRLREFTKHYIRETLKTERLALVGRFTGSIVHDLKNPLNVIGISADLLVSDDSDAESRRKSSKRIRRQVERITDMISEVLEFTRTDKQSFIPARLSYAQFLQQVLEEEGPDLQARGVRLVVEGELPEVDLLLNPKRLYRVFLNLLNNAAEAMDNKGQITLRFTEDNEGVSTEVADTGPGIPPEVADDLFEAFVTHGKAQGTGLGLAIAQNIVENHEGRLSAANGPTGGAVFTLWLPKH